MLRLWTVRYGREKGEEPPADESSGWKLSAVRNERYQREAREYEAGEMLWMRSEYNYPRSEEEGEDVET
jgi:hypothetical protein